MILLITPVLKSSQTFTYRRLAYILKFVAIAIIAYFLWLLDLARDKRHFRR